MLTRWWSFSEGGSQTPVSDRKLLGMVLVGTAIAIHAFGLPADAAGQDAHYWTQQYGTRSIFLGGAVIGSVADLSATYYNPGAIALSTEPEFLLSAQAFQYRNLTIEDGAGLGIDLSSSTVRPTADIIAGNIPFNWLGKHRLAYSFVTRQRLNASFEALFADTLDLLPAVPGDEFTGTELILAQDLSETWVGLTWSIPLTSKFGVGVTNYLAVRSQRTRFQDLTQVYSTTGDVGAAITIKDYEFTDYRALWKIGAAWRVGDALRLGVNVTTPSLHVAGSGSTLQVETVSDVDLTGDGTSDGKVEKDFQDDLQTQYRSSWAVGGGVGWFIGATGMHVAVEWFDARERYDVLVTEPFVGETTGAILENRVVQELKDVTNFGVGLEHHFADNFGLYGGFSTDFSAAVPQGEDNTSLSTWNLYHVSTGTDITMGSFDVLFGFGYSFGRQSIERLVDGFADDAEGTGLVIYRSLKVVFGFNVGF